MRKSDFVSRRHFDENLRVKVEELRFYAHGGIIQPSVCLPLRNGCLFTNSRAAVGPIQSRLTGRSRVNRLTKMLFATLVLGAGLSATGAAYAVDDATFNQCWGEITKQFAQVEDGQAGLGEHASAPPGFEPGTGGRDGVGNVSEDDPRFGGLDLSEGAQGAHANFVGVTQMGLDPCDGPPLP